MTYRIDSESGIPIYRQIIEQTKFAVTRSELKPGAQLPTVRQLAVDLSINPNTVIRAYRELEREGIIDTQQGSGTFVSSNRPDVDELKRQKKLDQIITEMLTRTSVYGFTLDEIVESLRTYQEASS